MTLMAQEAAVASNCLMQNSVQLPDGHTSKRLYRQRRDRHRCRAARRAPADLYYVAVLDAYAQLHAIAANRMFGKSSADAFTGEGGEFADTIAALKQSAQAIRDHDKETA